MPCHGGTLMKETPFGWPSKNRGGPPKSSILVGFSIIKHPFWGTSIFGNTHSSGYKSLSKFQHVPTSPECWDL